MFSLLTPLLKLAFCQLALGSGPEQRSRYTRLLLTIGKWSMADVFVVAVFLALFTLDESQFSHSWLGHGLYFFAAYCVLSIAASQLMQRLVRAAAHEAR